MAFFRPSWASETKRATPEGPPGDEPAQERRPAGPILGGALVDADDLPMAVGVHARGDHHCHAHERLLRPPAGLERPGKYEPLRSFGMSKVIVPPECPTGAAGAYCGC